MIKKGIIAWIASGIFVNLWALLTCVGLFRWVYFVEPTNIYRISMIERETWWVALVVFFNFICAGIFVFVYALVRNSIPSKGTYKGFMFGILLWLAGWFIPVVRFFMTINMSYALLTYALIIEGLAFYILNGIIISVIYEK